MTSSGYSGEVRGVLRDGEIGDQPPLDEKRDFGNSLLALLLKAEAILKRDYQCPTDCTVEALLPAREALISDQYLQQGDENVQVVVTSCLNEIEAEEDCTLQVKNGGDNISTVNHDGEETVAVGQSGDGVSKLGGGGEGNLLHDENQQTLQLGSNDAERLQSEMGVIACGRRGRKPNSLLRPEEGYIHPWTIGYVGKRRRSKNKESTMKEHNDQELRTGPRKTVQSKVKTRGSDIPESRTKTVGAGSSTISLEKGEGSHSVFQLLGKEIGDVADKMLESPISEPAKFKYPGNLSSEEMSREPNVDYGEEMVNSRIMVWWPLDKTFYTGTVQSFDPLTKKHKIIYDDDEEEVLYLREERWELFDEMPRQIRSSHNEEAEHQSPAEEPAKTEKKTSKRKTSSSRKQHAPTSPKRIQIKE